MRQLELQRATWTVLSDWTQLPASLNFFLFELPDAKVEVTVWLTVTSTIESVGDRRQGSLETTISTYDGLKGSTQLTSQ